MRRNHGTYWAKHSVSRDDPTTSPVAYVAARSGLGRTRFDLHFADLLRAVAHVFLKLRQPSSASFLTSGPGYSVGMSNLVVVRDEVDGWDVIREDDPQALTNTPTKQAAIEAARRFLADEGDDGEVVVHECEVHGIDDTGRGVKLYVMALLGLLAVIIAIIVTTSLLAHWTLPGGG